MWPLPGCLPGPRGGHAAQPQAVDSQRARHVPQARSGAGEIRERRRRQAGRRGDQGRRVVVMHDVRRMRPRVPGADRACGYHRGHAPLSGQRGPDGRHAAGGACQAGPLWQLVRPVRPRARQVGAAGQAQDQGRAQGAGRVLCGSSAITPRTARAWPRSHARQRRCSKRPGWTLAFCTRPSATPATTCAAWAKKGCLRCWWKRTWRRSARVSSRRSSPPTRTRTTRSRTSTRRTAMRRHPDACITPNCSTS